MARVAEAVMALKDGVIKIGAGVGELCEIVQMQEQRLRQLEEPGNLRVQLRNLERSIDDLPDQTKKEAAMAEFASLCHALGIESLED